MSVTATISHITRGSLHDGPGVRTVVYLKGCNLRCRWCHNPETFSATPDLVYAPSKCIHCGRCVELCPDGHAVDGDTMRLCRDVCTKCGRCADRCPTGALSLCGDTMTVDRLMAEIRKDAHYFRQSDGGVTLSGGECLLQAEFCAAILSACREAGIHTMIETALFVPWESVDKVWPLCDAMFADLKIADDAKHREFTGHGNQTILDNLARLVAAAPAGTVTVRIPLIPQVNDTAADIDGFAAILKPMAARLAGVEVLRYNTLAESKYRSLDRDYHDFGETQTDEEMAAFVTRLSAALDGKTTVFSV